MLLEPHQIRSKIVTISAYETTDFFTAKLDSEYDDVLCENGTVPHLVKVDSLYFSNIEFSETYTYDTLETDLKLCVDLIKNADIVTIFSSLNNEDKNPPQYEIFLNRLFHLKNGQINKEIWGNTNMSNKKLRLIRIFKHLNQKIKITDQQICDKFLSDKPGIMNTKFLMLGFREIYHSTYRNFYNDIQSPFGGKYIKKIRSLAEKDTYLSYQSPNKE